MNPEEIRKKRLALGLKQDELGDKLGVARNTVSRWELGDVEPPAYLERALRDLAREMQQADKPLQ
jgi:transcriptional regulator with XRE-family HTH domain